MSCWRCGSILVSYTTDGPFYCDDKYFCHWIQGIRGKHLGKTQLCVLRCNRCEMEHNFVSFIVKLLVTKVQVITKCYISFYEFIDHCYSFFKKKSSSWFSQIKQTRNRLIRRKHQTFLKSCHQTPNHQATWRSCLRRWVIVISLVILKT